MSVNNWALLELELSLWQKEGLHATFWWRDDDAVASTERLGQLLRLAHGIPLALAVIPSLTTESLAAQVRTQRDVVVLQHGWAHTDHTAGQFCEYPDFRNAMEVQEELLRGRAILQDLFDEQFYPIFVPPFNAFSDNFMHLLVNSGFQAISRKGPRKSPPLRGMPQELNVHVAPIVWSDPATFGSEDDHMSSILSHLRARRTGLICLNEPTGLLTHHLAQDGESILFIEKFVSIVSQCPTASWLDCRTALQQQ
jgi:hypothetical protein